MKIALVTLNDSTDVHQWSGLNYYIARSLEQAGASVHRIGPLHTKWTTAMRFRQRWHDTIGSTYHAVIEPAALDAMGAKARGQIPGDADAVLAVTSLVAAAIGPLSIPFASWDDATNAAMTSYYPDFKNMAAITRRHSRMLGERAVNAVSLAIYASDWAARSAQDAYGLPADRVAVVPFGANLNAIPYTGDVRLAIANRPTDVCRLLWVGVDWKRKGGPLTVAIAQAMRDAGVPVELIVVGCQPEDAASLPPWVRLEGFISKRDPAGEQRLADLFSQAHFFIMPSSAEAYGLVYVEAATYGVPAVAIRTGGVPTIIADDVTGVLEDPGTDAARFASRMVELYRDRARYESMAMAARRRATSQLNWGVAGRAVVAHLTRLIGAPAR